MKRKSIFIVIFIVLSVLLSNKISYGLAFINREIVNSPKEIIRIEKFLKDNDNYLGEDEKAKFIEIKEKMQRYEAVSQEEFDYMRECERDVIRKKIGDATFEEYSKLIRKRDSKAEFTPPERFRLLEIEKMIKSVK